MLESTVTSRGRITLPKEVRTALRLKPGDRLRYRILDGGEVRLLRSRPVAGLAGLLQGKTSRAVSLEEMEDTIARGAMGK